MNKLVSRFNKFMSTRSTLVKFLISLGAFIVLMVAATLLVRLVFGAPITERLHRFMFRGVF